MRDEWFLPGLHQAPRQRSSPFFPKEKGHQIVARPLLVSHPSFCLSCPHLRWWRWRVGIWAPAPSGWVRGHASLPTQGYWMEGEGEPSVQAMQSHFCTRWTRLLGSWTSGFGATHYGCAQGLPGQDARQWRGRFWCSFTQGPEERDNSVPTRHQSHRPGHRAVDVQPCSVGTWPLAHDDGDERGGQGSLPRCSGLVKQPVRSCCGGLYGGSEVVSSDATLPPETHQLFCCFQSPQTCADSAAS